MTLTSFKVILADVCRTANKREILLNKKSKNERFIEQSTNNSYKEAFERKDKI